MEPISKAQILLTLNLYDSVRTSGVPDSHYPVNVKHWNPWTSGIFNLGRYFPAERESRQAASHTVHPQREKERERVRELERERKKQKLLEIEDLGRF